MILKYIQDYTIILSVLLMGPYFGLLLGVLYRRHTWEEINQYKLAGILFLVGFVLMIYSFISFEV